MKKIVLLVASVLLCSGGLHAQGLVDAYKYSQTDLSGSARSLGMAGAFGALGGDISSMSTNPGGLAIYRSSEVLTTLNLSTINTKTNWKGIGISDNKTKFGLDNIAYVGYFPTSNDVGILSWNVGFAYNRVKNYNRTYRANGAPDYSLSDYIAARATGIPYGGISAGPGASDPYNKYDWLSVLGYESGMIQGPQGKDTPPGNDTYQSTFQNAAGVPYPLDEAQLKVNERGAIDKYDFSFATNISDRVFLGATFSVTDMDYRMSTVYDEWFEGDNNLYLENSLKTTGTGYSFNLGAIVRPVDFLRLGVAYNSPTWYKMTDYYRAEAGTFNQAFLPNDAEINVTTGDEAYSPYEYRSPDRWIFSVAAILGKSAVINMDYELTNYGGMKMYDDGGNGLDGTNGDIKNCLRAGRTLRVGAEVKVTPQFSVRAGGAWLSSPLKDNLKDPGAEVVTVGTIPNYTLDKGTSYYTVGLGYRFTPNFYADLACVLKSNKEDLHAFSNIPDANGNWIDSDAISLKTKTTRFALTVGYKF